MASPHDSSFYCITEDELPDDGKRLVYVSVSIVSATLGLIGAIVQIVSYFPETKAYMNTRGTQRYIKLNPQIIFLLACTNLLFCIGVIGRSLGIQIVAQPHTDDMPRINQNSSCPDTKSQPSVSGEMMITSVVLETITDYSFIASVMWTLSFAVNMYYQLQGKIASMKLLQAMSWTVPSICTISVTVLMYGGSKGLQYCSEHDKLLVRYTVFYGPVVLSFVASCFLYWRSSHVVSQMFLKLTSTLSHKERAVIRRFRRRFLSIIIVFGICWVPNIIDSILQLVLISSCRSKDQHKLLFPFWITEAIFNPLQGLLNCFLYGGKNSCQSLKISSLGKKSILSSMNATTSDRHGYVPIAEANV